MRDRVHPPAPSCVSCSFNSPGYRPPLHSFPTRRSSDLTRFRSWTRTTWQFRLSLSATASNPPRSEMEYWRADRKSTRLNSSHRTISYAVFCLKKKNQIPEGRRDLGQRLAVDHQVRHLPL